MEIILGKTAGFCYGVKNAVQKTAEKLNEFNEVYCLGELIHNGQVIKELENAGLKIVDKLEQAKDRIIIRAHGIAKAEYLKAQELKIEVLDYTCPNVLSIHKIADAYATQGYYIFLIGAKNHPENRGTISFCGENSCIIETEDDINTASKLFQASNLKKLLIIVQTTFNLEKFNAYVAAIKQQLAPDIALEVKNTICNATRIRQEETRAIAKNVPCMIIIGGKNSSNTKKLYDIAKENCANTFCVETQADLNLNLIKQFPKIGVMAGASTPNASIQAIIETIRT